MTEAQAFYDPIKASDLRMTISDAGSVLPREVVRVRTMLPGVADYDAILAGLADVHARAVADLRALRALPVQLDPPRPKRDVPGRPDLIAYLGRTYLVDYGTKILRNVVLSDTGWRSLSWVYPASNKQVALNGSAIRRVMEVTPDGR